MPEEKTHLDRMRAILDEAGFKYKIKSLEPTEHQRIMHSRGTIKDLSSLSGTVLELDYQADFRFDLQGRLKEIVGGNDY